MRSAPGIAAAICFALGLASSLPASAVVDLSVARVTATEVRLDWTGGQGPYSIYRSTSPAGLVAPANLAATVSSGTTWTDTSAVGPILFYDVEPSIDCSSGACTVRTCGGHVYQCGDCIDNDGDCRIDADDPDCLGPCDNSEDSLYPAIPGFNPPPCTQDCFFDGDTGSGNDDCGWTHKCDPLEIAPSYPPEGSQCSYDPNATLFGRTCTQMMSSQSSACTGFCGPLTPNGCDSFGCCSIPGAPGPVWLGSLNATGTGSCTLDVLNDPTLCKPCTQVLSALNACEHCELCVGKTTLPADCPVQTCPAGAALCGLPGQPQCAAGSYCITGCCQPLP